MQLQCIGKATSADADKTRNILIWVETDFYGSSIPKPQFRESANFMDSGE